MEKRKNYNVHHVMGKKYKHIYNVGIPQNKKIVEITKHEALNCLVWDKQSPQEQLSVLYNDWRISILSKKARKEIEKLLSMSDEDFYIPWLKKNDRKRNHWQDARER